MNKKNFVVHYFWCENDFGENYSKPFYHKSAAIKEMNRLDKVHEHIKSFLSEVIDLKSLV